MGNWGSSSLVGVGREVVAGLVDKAEVQPCRWSWELWLVLGSGAKPVLGGVELFTGGRPGASWHVCLVSPRPFRGTLNSNLHC